MPWLPMSLRCYHRGNKDVPRGILPSPAVWLPWDHQTLLPPGRRLRGCSRVIYLKEQMARQYNTNNFYRIFQTSTQILFIVKISLKTVEVLSFNSLGWKDQIYFFTKIQLTYTCLRNQERD